MSAERPKERKPADVESGEVRRIMTEEQTIAFLDEHGVGRIDPEKWLPHQPVLYVMEEGVRTHEKGPFNDLPLEKRPSIARINDPLAIHFDTPLGDSVDDRVVYGLESDAGQVDYYVIDAASGKPELIRTSHSRMLAPLQYHVRKEALFNAADDLFPRAQEG